MYQLTYYTLSQVKCIQVKSSQVKSSAVVKNDQKIVADIFKVHVKIW
jgi:hypothetical protein